MAEIVSWFWEFGDGETSTLPNPNHVYAMSGSYNVTETVTDDSGNVSKAYGMVYVYDFDYRGGIPNASLTGVCYRLPVRAGEGFGVSEYKDSFNPGFDWVWPPANIQIGKGYDVLKKEIALVLDSKTQREFQINDDEIWFERVGSYDGGHVVQSEIHQKGHSCEEGEHIPIRHIEHHLSFDSYDRKRFQEQPGFDGEGFPIGFTVKNQLFKDGEPFSPVAETKKIPLDGDLVFQEKIEARTLQLRTVVVGSPYLLDGVTPYYETVDKHSVPSLRVMTEDAYQIDMASMPLFHVSRNYNPLLNLATGGNAVGTYGSLVAGPDGRLMSAIMFGLSDSGIRDVSPEEIFGNFTAYSWIKNAPISIAPKTIFNTSNFIVETLNDSNVFSISITDPNGGAIVALEGNGHEWFLVTVVRRGNAIRVYENKKLLGEFTVPVVSNYGRNISFGDSEISIFDPCVVPRAVSLDGIEYYYDDIIRGGEQVLQPF